MPELKPQSVAIRVPLKAYLSDGVTAATGKTIAIVISKNGGAFGNPSGGATNATEIANGWYYVDLSTTDTGTLGPLIVRGTATGVDDVETVYDIVNPNNAGFAALPDAAAAASGGLFIRGTGAGAINQAANGQIDVNVVALSGDTPAADNAEAFFDGTGYAGTNNVIPTVTTLTNLPAITANWLTAAGIAAGALNGKGDWNIGKTGYALSAAGVQAIWDALTSALTTIGSIGKLIVDNLNATVSSRSTLDAAGVRTAVGLAAANLDTQLGDLPTAAEVWDLADGIETGLTPRQAMRLFAAALAGKLSGAATVTVTIRNAVADNKSRIIATVDADGNRTGIVYDVS